MKKLLTRLGQVLQSLYSNEEVTPDQLVVRLGITYKINSTTPFTGSSVDYHDNGQMSSGGKYKDGKRHGFFESFDKDGKQEGLWESYYENGQLEEKGNFKDGELDGHHEWFYENGQLCKRGNFIDGKLDGLWEGFHENGQLREGGNYKDGKRDGLVEGFHENGQLRDRGNFIDGKEITETRFNNFMGIILNELVCWF